MSAIQVNALNNTLRNVQVVTILVLIYAIVGAVKCVTGDITFEEYIHLMDVPVAGLAIGRGLAARKA